MFEELLSIVSSQKNMIDFVEGRHRSAWLPQDNVILQIPTDCFVESYKMEDVLRLLDEIMAYIEEDSTLNLRYRDLKFFNDRNVCPILGYSCCAEAKEGIN